MSDKPLKLRIVTPDSEFVLPYIERELPDVELVDADADITVFITQDINQLSHRPDETAVALHCPNIVGTGMSGKPMKMARAIASGNYYHIQGKEARLSTVHATDVAKAVALALHSPGVYTVTDLCDPTYDSLADALAHRIKDRRIYTLKGLWAKLLMSPSLRRMVSTDYTHDGSDFASRFDFKPVSVVEYLMTHVYDDESL